MRAYVGDLLAGRETARAVAFSERLGTLVGEAAATVPVCGELVLSRVGPTVRVDGRVATRVALVCGACLASFEQPLEVTIDEEFSRGGAVEHAPSGEPLGAEAFLAPVEPGDMIDLTEIVRQHLVLALPIAPRCSSDCRGLCPRCGADRNAGTCGCDTEGIDPRLQALEGWGRTERPPRGPRGARTGRGPIKERGRWD